MSQLDTRSARQHSHIEQHTQRHSSSRHVSSMRSAESALDRYRPHLMLRSGHLQTIFGALVTGAMPAYSATTRLVKLSDGEAMVVHQEDSSQLRDDAPLAIMVHGLGGDHRSPYLRRIAARLSGRGMRVWRVDLRGCGAGLEHAFRPAHAGSSFDLAAVVAHAQQVFPKSQLALAAYSLGGNILLKMLGELTTAPASVHQEIDPTRIALAVAVAPPAHLKGCAINMERLSRLPYTRYYLKMLSRQVRARADHWEAWRSIRPDVAVRTMRQFDHWYTAPLGGFTSIDQYYESSSSASALSRIGVPTRLLLDQHDPIIPFGAFEGIEFSPSVEVEITRFGGHLGYIAQGPRGRARRWMDEWTEASLCKALGLS